MLQWQQMKLQQAVVMQLQEQKVVVMLAQPVVMGRQHPWSINYCSGTFGVGLFAGRVLSSNSAAVHSCHNRALLIRNVL